MLEIFLPSLFIVAFFISIIALLWWNGRSDDSCTVHHFEKERSRREWKVDNDGVHERYKFFCQHEGCNEWEYRFERVQDMHILHFKQILEWYDE